MSNLLEILRQNINPSAWVILLLLVFVLQPLAPLRGATLPEDPDYEGRALKTLNEATGSSSAYSQHWGDSAKTYVVKFGGRSGSTDTRGHYKITVVGGLAEAEKRGWTVLSKDPVSGIEVSWKRVERSTERRWTDVSARYAYRNLTLTVQGRRPFAEDPGVGGREMKQRLNRLITLAQKNNLFTICNQQLDSGLTTQDGFEEKARALKAKVDKWRRETVDVDPANNVGVRLPRCRLRYQSHERSLLPTGSLAPK